MQSLTELQNCRGIENKFALKAIDVKWICPYIKETWACQFSSLTMSNFWFMPLKGRMGRPHTNLNFHAIYQEPPSPIRVADLPIWEILDRLLSAYRNFFIASTKEFCAWLDIGFMYLQLRCVHLQLWINIRLVRFFRWAWLLSTLNGDSQSQCNRFSLVGDWMTVARFIKGPFTRTESQRLRQHQVCFWRNSWCDAKSFVKQ